MEYAIAVLSLIGIQAFVALSAYLLLIAGQISFGQQAFFASGAYAAGIATALWKWPLSAGIAFGAGVAGALAALVAIPTLRMRGLYFAIATLAFAELVRLLLLRLYYQVEVDGELLGPAGADGFGGIRYALEHDISPPEYLGLIALLLALVMGFFAVLERSRLGSILRMIGEDEVAAATQGVRPAAFKILAATIAGTIAGIGGGLFAHYVTYVEPGHSGVMLGVHSLAYGLIGGLGTAWGPLLGASLDIGLLESLRIFRGYRMIAFGGLVAVLLIFRPRGLLDEALVHRLGTRLRRRSREQTC